MMATLGTAGTGVDHANEDAFAGTMADCIRQ